eukprot:7517352-Heterocapsa_arctica.AAC.1
MTSCQVSPSNDSAELLHQDHPGQGEPLHQDHPGQGEVDDHDRGFGHGYDEERDDQQPGHYCEAEHRVDHGPREDRSSAELPHHDYSGQ